MPIRRLPLDFLVLCILARSIQTEKLERELHALGTDKEEVQ
ncbi:MAG TPA: hypothetical protein VIG66_04495 [Noviherbaspirillum sp.]